MSERRVSERRREESEGNGRGTKRGYGSGGRQGRIQVTFLGEEQFLKSDDLFLLFRVATQ